MTSSAPAPPDQSAPPEPAPHGGISRRALLTAGLGSAAVLAAGSAIAVWTGSGGPTATPRRVTPLWSELAYRSFGVVSHPTFQNTTYGYTEEWLTALDDLGVRYFRGMYADHLPLVQTTVAGARARGLQWGMLVCNDLDTPPEVVQRRVADIARNAADLCLFVEGINEPNANGSSPVRPDWAERTVAQQRTIYEAVRSHPELDRVTVIGPSLHAAEATEADYERLAGLGLGEVLDVLGLHSYPAGHYPSQGLDLRLAEMRPSFPDTGVWLTETGYNNAVGSSDTRGGTPVPEAVAAAYAPAAVLEAVDRGMPIAWYEVLDDPDPGARDNVQSNYGMLAVEGDGAPPWRPKPVVAALRSFLAGLRDPGPVHRPEPVTLTVTSPVDDVRWTALGKRDGSTWLHLRRSVDVWDTATGSPVAVDPVRVTVASPAGRTTATVGAEVTTLRL